MADTGKQSPLGQNVLGGLLQNRCIQINPNAQDYMGISRSNDQYTFGTLVEGTVLRMLTWSINDAYLRGLVSNGVYDNIISISGNGKCYALGNSKPPTYVVEDPSEVWTDKSKEAGALYAGGPANAGYSVAGNTDYGQSATWAPYDSSNVNKSITQWGWIRCHALQAHNEFNYHAKEGLEGAVLNSNPSPKYEDFTASFQTAEGWINANNPVAIIAENAPEFMEGAFSNMDDLITGDFSGVTKSLGLFGDNLKFLGKLIDLKNLDKFGFPSTLLQQLFKNGGLTQDLNLAIGAAGLTANRLKLISKGETVATALEEKQLYAAYVLISGENLKNCIAPMTPFVDWCLGDDAIRTLADCLNVRRLFFLIKCWSTLTVPLYNATTDLPTGAKTYYLIYNSDGSVNGALNTDAVKNRVGTLMVNGTPSTTTSGDVQINKLPKGYDSYLGGANNVLPTEIGLAAAAFRYAMLQITNIDQLTPGTIGRCVGQLELNTENGSGANGTEGSPTGLAKPINESLQATVPEEISLGSGWAGTYTYSDFFGCMSGLPYAWERIYTLINQTGATQIASRSTLAKIYQQLFLAVTWEAPAITLSLQYQCVQNTPKYANPANPDYQPDPALPDPDPFPYLEYNDNSIKTMDQWTVATFFGQYKVKSQDVLAGDGGGYGRGGAPDPTCSINYGSYPSDGTSVSISGIGRSDSATGTSGGTLIRGGFGRIQAASTSGGSFTQWPNTPSPIPATQALPDGPPPGFSGIASPQDSNPGYNAPDANTDIVAEPQYPPTGTYDKYATNGTNSAYGSSFNYNTVIQDYIDQANDEIPNIVDPNVAYSLGVDNLNVAWDVLGRQLKVEQRARYISINPVEVPRSPFVSSSGTVVTFVDSIPTLSLDTRPHMSAQTIEAIVDRNCAVGQSAIAMMRQERNQKRLANCGIPLSNNLSDKMSGEDQTIITTNGTIEPAKEGIPQNFTDLVFTNPAFPNNPGPSGPVYPQPQGYYSSPYFFPVVDLVPYGDYTPILQDVTPVIPQVFNDGNDPTLVVDPFNPGNPGDSSGGGGQAGSGNGGPINGGGQTSPPGGGGTGGTGNESGPFGGSGIDGNGGNNGTITNPVIIRDVIPKSQQTINLNPNYTGGILQPAGISVDDAIEQVILCNCDCWDLI